MKIAFAAAENSLESSVDTRFGRAAGFIIFDTATGEWHFKSNDQNYNAAQGAGIQAAEHVVNAEAECLVCQHCGPKAFRVLNAVGIKVYTGIKASITDAIKMVEQGALTEAQAADVEGHWL